MTRWLTISVLLALCLSSGGHAVPITSHRPVRAALTTGVAAR